MEMKDYINPHLDEDPRGGCQMIDSSRFRCQKCIQYGSLDHEEMRVIPCTICAMANGGAWGWKKDHYGDPMYSLRQNGNPPGKDGITDVLTRNDIDPLSEYYFSDEEVILGFAQYALYNHYKWKDILDLGEGKSKSKTGVPPMDYLKPTGNDELGGHWYWWKIIPYGVVLPKRLRNVLQKQLVKYDLEILNPEIFIPKTHQLKGDREISDDVWETFWDTYVEPGHVAHLFYTTLENFLETNIPHRNNLATAGGWFNNILNQFHIIEHPDIYNYNLPASDLSWINIWCATRFNENTKCFILSGEGEDFDEGNQRVIKILDRNVFGTYLENVIHYVVDSSFYRRTGIRSPTEKETWNSLNNDLSSLYYDVFNNFCIEDTSWFEGRRDYAPYPADDYDIEKFFREENCQYSSPVYDNVTYEVEYEIESDEEGVSNYDWSNHTDKLKELQAMIDDENVKDKINEGDYLKLMNTLNDIYKLCQ
tara:strand:+ start:77 stop:1510 length:1434 start_codon:yes stop_codon:yes gene_type:complete